MAARCETVLNTTMAEMDTFHTQKVEDFQALAKDHLDGEIALYEQVRRRLTPPLSLTDDPLLHADPASAAQRAGDVRRPDIRITEPRAESALHV